MTPRRSALFIPLALTAFSVPQAFGADLPAADAVEAEKLFEVHAYCEGVVFDHKGYGYTSHGDRITRFSPDGKEHEVWATTGAPNGHKILADGTHLVCDASRHAVLRLNESGEVVGAAAHDCGGRPLRGPNDLTLDPAGGFYFTDPGESSRENPIGTVHYVDRNGTCHLVTEGLAFPNGIVLRPDRKTLLVAESQKNHVLEYAVEQPGKVGPMRVFAELPSKQGDQIDNQPDGMCLDGNGNLYVAHYGMRQVQVLDPKGKLVRRYPGGNLTTSNVAFGGENHDQLYITGGLRAEAGGGGVFRIDLGVKGLVILPERAE